MSLNKYKYNTNLFIEWGDVRVKRESAASDEKNLYPVGERICVRFHVLIVTHVIA